MERHKKLSTKYTREDWIIQHFEQTQVYNRSWRHTVVIRRLYKAIAHQGLDGCLEVRWAFDTKTGELLDPLGAVLDLLLRGSLHFLKLLHLGALLFSAILGLLE